MKTNGLWTDFIDAFMTYTEQDITTRLHRQWSAISTIAGALERRVWVRAGKRITFPNLYTILVAPPGTGKYIIEYVSALWNDTREISNLDKPAFRTAPHSVSRASLIDDLNKSQKTFLPPQGTIITFHSLLVAAEEFEVLMPSYDPLFIGTLNRIWNNPSYHKETRRHGPADSREINMPFPQLNILAGATPAYFAAHFPEEAWNTGLIRRTILVFSATPQQKDFFSPDETSEEDFSDLLHRLSTLSNLYGEASWSIEAFNKIRTWHNLGTNNNGGPPVPTHSKLQYYNTTRTQTLIKLSLISGVSRLGFPKIEESDVTRAMDWLFEVEALMPDIFRAMAGRSDHQILEELHYWIYSQFISNKQKPVHATRIRYFLSQKVPSEKVENLLKLATATNVIARLAGHDDLFVPRPKEFHGQEGN